VAVFVVAVLIAGCTGDAPSAARTSTSAETAGGAVDAVRRAIDAVNATAGGDVAAQQRVLARLVDPARAAEQAACAPAGITVRIDPVLDRLTPVEAPPPGSAPASGGSPAAPTPGAVRYRLPALLEVYTGPIRTGTDLAGLEVTVADGIAHTAPLCLR
jgi:hypothetical protein